MRLYARFRAVRGVALAALSLLSTALSAGGLIDLTVSENAGVYRVRTEMRVDAPSRYVYQVLTDFVHIYRLNPSITDSAVLPSLQEGVDRVRTLVENCVFIFCYRLLRVEQVRRDGPGHLRMEIVPELSNVRSGVSEIWIRPEGQRCRVTYTSTLEPDFFLPPGVGSLFVKSELRNGVSILLKNLECIARIKAGDSHQPPCDTD